MKVTVHDSISAIASADWNALAGDSFPFLNHAFLELAEQTGSVSPDAGWTPRHLTLETGGKLRAALPLYEKSHSWGEFVFDWAWAQAYEQAGFDYYPKLVSAVPFTPAPATRILLADQDDVEAAQVLVAAATKLASDTGCSSVHFLFPEEQEVTLFEECGLLIRKDCQFHWHNRDYGSFDDFLATFTSAKRKKAKRDRRRVAENGIRFRRLHGADLDPDIWSTVYALIARTFTMRGSLPYFNQAFFEGLGTRLPDNILVILAELEGQAVAAAVFFESATTLYGRYWGSDGHFDALHFETCYYQGIEYCIETGKQLFEPGTQGEHKISRGFSPVTTWSAHWLAHPEFADAIGRYLDAEGRHIEKYIETVDRHTPYKDEE
ncbi:MAG: GNAT family N-acetyltransferase [Gammaproteobacteria bacterium]|nr:GNAT family N-acetyltransferase [Gammaproteobacteria bacterium]